MSRKTAKLAAVIAIGMAAGLTLTAVPRAVHAADECLTEPKGPSLQGKHWFYHTERGTGRKCWYQRGQDEATGTSSQDQSADANDDAPSPKDQLQAANDPAPVPIVRPPARRSETPATRSIAISDARAEVPAKTHASDDSTTAPATTATSPTATSATVGAAPAAAPSNTPSASVFPDPSAVLAAKPATDAPSSNEDTQADTTASVTPEPAASPAPVVERQSVDRQSTDPHRGSIPMLLMVAFGALGLAGLTGSTVYRLASVTRRRQDRWQRNVQLQPAPARRPRPVAARPEPIQQAIEEPIQDQFEDHRFAHDHDHDAHDHHAPAAHDAPEQLQADHLAPEPAALELFAPRPRTKVSRAEPPRAETRTSDANGRRAQIEAHLAQLTRQLQADLAAPARAE